MRIKNRVLLLMIFFFISETKAQDDWASDTNGGVEKYAATFTLNPDIILTQHWAMPTLLNPASSGEIDFVRLRVGTRLDYFGSHASPKNFMGTADSPFKLFGKRIGAGLMVNSGTYDLWSNLQLAAQGSYMLKIKKSTISIGVQIGYFKSKFKGSDLVASTQGNGKPYTRDGSEGASGGGEGTEAPSYEDNDGFNPERDLPTEDVDAGVFDLAIGAIYEHPKFHLGISVQHLTNPTLKLTREGALASDTKYLECKLPMTLYFEAGGNIAINNTLFTLQPSLVVGSDFKNLLGVAEMRTTYKEMLTFGVNYRWNHAAGLVAGLFLKNFYVGYNWEYDYSRHPRGSTGNHELVLGYRFKMDMSGKSNFSHRSVRIM